ncbi:NAD(P)-dependent oxidoreductase [Pseudomonas sp. RL]|uniref:NAD-dependent epimerase/dehydratase family protein n=1 Tax=Pseudomonas sp. RL TaxID=1452718 RepID=UPI0009DFA8F7|nr:NAD(P)-dependent oxidoreductase [Pseudomonas sp. RL]
MPDFSPYSSTIQRALQKIPATLGLHEKLAGQHLLLTGGTGFFGRWLLALLYQLNMQGVGVNVTVLSRNPARFLEAQPRYHDCSWLQWLSGDVRDALVIRERPVNLIVHAAADTSAAAHGRPLDLFDTIVVGARRVLDLAAQHDARVLLTGSGAQYGIFPGDSDQDKGIVETFAGACVSDNANSAYGEAKRAQETLAAIYAQHYGLPIVMTRCFAFAGPGLPLDGHFAIGNFVRDALWADEIVLHSSGQAVRSYLHGADLAGWLLTLLVKGQPGLTYNVGSDDAISVAALAQRVMERIAPDKPLRILGRPDDSSRSFYVPDISRARRLGLDVWTGLDQSIDSMATWARLQGYGD